MHIHARSLAFAVAVTLSGGYALTAVRAAAPSPQEASVSGLPDASALSDAMGGMADAKRATRKAVKAGDSAAALAALSEFQVQVVAAKAEAPPRAAKMSAEEQAAFVSGFRAMLIELLRASCDVEVALMEGQLEQASTILRSQMGELEERGHERFGGEDEG
ncbi:MAG: hypothetical protein DHS20C15_32140 [Planctomycetota bacterium]|nr:MAG: hypothetical protein DHS20C15_32140 [Planctomycetota bacterium]